MIGTAFLHRWAWCPHQPQAVSPVFQTHHLNRSTLAEGKGLAQLSALSSAKALRIWAVDIGFSTGTWDLQG